MKAFCADHLRKDKSGRRLGLSCRRAAFLADQPEREIRNAGQRREPNIIFEFQRSVFSFQDKAVDMSVEKFADFPAFLWSIALFYTASFKIHIDSFPKSKWFRNSEARNYGTV